MNAEVLSSDFATGLELLTDVILNPTFPPPPNSTANAKSRSPAFAETRMSC